MTTVLTRSQLAALLTAGEIFEEGTWDDNQLRPASYDIRIASDVLRIPNADPYKWGHPRRDPITLEPGDVAFVTSQEEFRLAPDLIGNIGVRFGFVSKGLLVHTGLIVDPGYGLDVPKETRSGRKRLHFLIVNLSNSRQTVTPGSAIVSIQFIKLDEAASCEPTPQSTLEDEYLLWNQPLGLSLITELQQLQKVDVPELGNRLRVVENASQDLIKFGVFIVAAAFLGVVFTELLDFVSNPTHEAAVSQLLTNHKLSIPWLILILAGAFGFVPLCCWALIKAVAWLASTVYPHVIRPVFVWIPTMKLRQLISSGVRRSWRYGKQQVK